MELRLKNQYTQVLADIKEHKQILTNINETNYTLYLHKTKFINNKLIVLAIIRYNGLQLKYIPEKFKSDRDVVLVAVQQNGNALYYASDILKTDKDIVLEIKLVGLSIIFPLIYKLLYIS